MKCRSTSRQFVLEVLVRLRESEEQARKATSVIGARLQFARAQAFDEVYTLMKGLGMDKNPW